MTPQHHVRRFVPILVAAALVLAVLACDDDDTQSPAGTSYDLSDAATVSVTLNVLGFFEYYDGLSPQWVELDLSLDDCVVTEEPAELTAAYNASDANTSTSDAIHLRFDPDSGDLESVEASHAYFFPAGSSNKSMKAYDVPLTSYVSADSTWTAIWRLDADAVCAALDTVTTRYTPSGGTLQYWTCMGEDPAWLEIRVTN